MKKLFAVVNITPRNGELAFVAREEDHAQSWALDRLHAGIEQANEERYHHPDLSNLEPAELYDLIIASAEYGTAELRIFAADMSLETLEFFDEEGDRYCFSRQEILTKLEECEEEERKKSRTRR